MAITLKQIDPHDDGWADYIGRIVVQWRDNIEQGPYLLAEGTDDPEKAATAEIDSWEPYEVQSTDWSQRLHVYRVKTALQMREEHYDDADIEAAFGGDDDEIVLDEIDVIGITLQPEEPPCQKHSWSRIRKKHKWIQGQAYAHGAGVQYDSTCKRCGTVRATDTWAQDMSDGSEGHHSIAYLEADGSKMLRPGVIE